MAEEIIKDFGGRIIGYIEIKPNGDKIGKDFYRRVVAKGNALSDLVWNYKNKT